MERFKTVKETRSLECDIRRIDMMDEDIICDVASLMARGPRSCDFCGSTSHLVAGCEKLGALAQDCSKGSRVKRVLDDLLQNGGGQSKSSTTNGGDSTPVRSMTTSTDEWLMNALESEEREQHDTEEDVGIHALTDDEENRSGASADTDFH